MNIELKKFGTTLVSRQAGKEAFLAFSPLLRNVKKNENIVINFEGVIVFTPSWADEFLTKIQENFPGKVTYINTENPSVKATLEILKKT